MRTNLSGRYRLLTHIIIFCAVFTLFFQFSGKATVLTVDNNHPRIGQFGTLQEAHDAASDGDTIYVFPSGFVYQAITVSKKLSIIGAGFSKEGHHKSTIISGNMHFVADSEGSLMSGFIDPGNQFSVEISTSQVSILRSRFFRIIVNENSHNIVISGCYINYHQWNANIFPLIMVKHNSNVLITNNVVTNSPRTDYSQGISIENSSAVIRNNIVDIGKSQSDTYALSYTNSDMDVSNNIFVSGSLTYSLEQPCVYKNNIGIKTRSIHFGSIPYPDCGTSNITDIGGELLNDIFIDYEGRNYHLKPDSPAIGTGLNGTDMGIYGGDTPFIDGGYPPIPSIYYLDVPLTGSQEDGINVIIKVKTVK